MADIICESIEYILGIESVTHRGFYYQVAPARCAVKSRTITHGLLNVVNLLLYHVLVSNTIR